MKGKKGTNFQKLGQSNELFSLFASYTSLGSVDESNEKLTGEDSLVFLFPFPSLRRCFSEVPVAWLVGKTRTPLPNYH